ncbi:hemerythrin [Methylomagnum ishizawai]|uniref:Hemerythrin n=1 Tax=Methylomagnum ishizawai TaxID=1760988 RepID=A0A1Y6DA95_9GAMM|nr:bacteriohemerythrin [Methylomagnum ishizawai]SMF97272.1 hemerythrin [Methylomagnum ishizawai]
MSLIVWSDKLAVGVKEIDDQHMKLVAIINELHDAMTVGHGKDVLTKVLDELVRYTVYHFATEERLMRLHGYADHINHEKEHKDLVNTAAELQKAVHAGTASLTLTTMHFLKDWLNHHILGSDMKLGHYLRGKGQH